MNLVIVTFEDYNWGRTVLVGVFEGDYRANGAIAEHCKMWNESGDDDIWLEETDYVKTCTMLNEIPAKSPYLT